MDSTKIKLNFAKIRPWMDQIINPNKSHSEYDNKSPKDWSTDDFRSYVFDQLDGKDRPTISLEMFGFPHNISLVEYFSQNPSNYNNNKYWNKYQNIGGALYDIWDYIKQKLGLSESYNKRIISKKILRESVTNKVKDVLKKRVREEVIRLYKKKLLSEVGGMIDSLRDLISNDVIKQIVHINDPTKLGNIKDRMIKILEKEGDIPATQNSIKKLAYRAAKELKYIKQDVKEW